MKYIVRKGYEYESRRGSQSQEACNPQAGQYLGGYIEGEEPIYAEIGDDVAGTMEQTYDLEATSVYNPYDYTLMGDHQGGG